MRRSPEGLGGEPCTRRTWCSDISPGRSSITLACAGSTSTATSWPRVSRLFFEKVSRCGIWSAVWVPGRYAIAPLPTLLGVSATQAVTTSGRLRPQ